MSAGWGRVCRFGLDWGMVVGRGMDFELLGVRLGFGWSTVEAHLSIICVD